MLRKAMLATLVTLGLATSAAFADTLIVEGIRKDASQQPGRGLTKAAVASKWGEPGAQSDAVGEPPISSWEYNGFVVYFENDHVLHTVAKR
jgi:hypothetical protein